ncbi:MAG TPA: metallophosphoesterase [Patescibacteria group bacterium]|nr:metallophosphoesterase [Patescibacteria group bacterium]
MGRETASERKVVAGAADLHVRRDVPSSRERFSSTIAAFIQGEAQYLFLNGDTFDQKATYDDVTFVAGELQKARLAGKRIFGLSGNHEERMTDPKHQKVISMLSEAGVEFFDDQLVELEGVVFVGVPCILSKPQQDGIHALPVREQAAAMQRQLEETHGETFEKLMEEAKRREKPVIVWFHNPPIAQAYGDELSNYDPVELPGRFAKAMDPHVVAVALNGHLHGKPFKGVRLAETPEGILIINNAIGVMGGITYVTLPESIGDIPAARTITGRRIQSQ